MKEGWFLLTNLGSLSEAVTVYKKRMGIEEMFRDYKSGGYNLGGTGLQDQRLMALILLIALAYTSAIIQGRTLQVKGSKNYVYPPKELKRKYPRRSFFGSGIDSQQWLSNLEKYAQQVEQLMTLTSNKRLFYQRGMKAVARILSSS
jgi:hypothetical protein